MKISIGSKTKPFLSEKMFGLFFEDINYAADGGLYAEMLENRQFEFRKASPGIAEKTYDDIYAGNYGWSLFPKNQKASMIYKTNSGFSDINPHYMTFDVPSEEAGFTNKAYDGIFLSKDHDYSFTAFIRNNSYKDDITIQVLTKDGQVAMEGKITPASNGEWSKYSIALHALCDVKEGIFLIKQKQGSLDYAYLSLMPKNAIAGVFRPDLFNMIADMKPGFLRFPGGCIVEGANLNNRYRWKETVGNPWERKCKYSRWAVHDVTMGQGEALYFPFYNQSFGIGFYEYFLLSELMGAKPLPVLSVGLACQFQSDELVPIDDPEFNEYLQDALDLIEFANGDENTKWGKLRCEMGHPLPFNLEYIGIGNEQWETDRVDFFDRYRAFEKAVHSVYPDIELLGSAGPDVTTERYTMAWDFYKTECSKNNKFTAAVDEHYYMPPAWFYEHIDMYDNYSRDIPVFAGEYAAHCEGKRNNMEAALAEAAFMCGLERNSDVIKFASVAPLFARNNYVQWIPDFIWFDGENVMGTPGYYVQKLFSLYTGTETVSYEGDIPDGIYLSVSRNEQNYYIKIVNSNDTIITLSAPIIEEKEVSLSNAMLKQIAAGSKDEENILGREETILLKDISLSDMEITLPALSVNVLIIPR